MDDDNSEAGAFETENSAVWERLNLTAFSSESFDPLTAIYSSDAFPEEEEVDIYENVDEFFSAHISNYKRKEKSSALSATVQSSNSQGLTASETENVNIQMIPTAAEPEMTEMIHPDNIQHHSRAEPARVVKVVVETEDLQDKQKAARADVSDSEEKRHTDHLRTKRPRTNAILQMERGFQEGPLSLLRRSVKEKLKVHVWTRSVRNIRGICTGFVVAFDKHMNMALMDVDEVYRKPAGKHKKGSKAKCRVTDSDSGSDPEDMEHKHETEMKREDSAFYPATPWKLVQEVPSTGDTAVMSHSSLSSFSQNSQHLVPCSGRVKQLTRHLVKDSSRSLNSNRHLGHGEDAVEEVSSAFSGMHVFQESKVSQLLGVKTRKLLCRHLNQILLRGDHVVAVALAEH